MKYEGTVVQVRQETPRVKTIRVSWPGIEALQFVPGQFFMLSIPGFVNQAGVQVRRAYSIASAPLDKGFVEFTITSKTPTGLSARAHELKVGDALSLDGPAGHFGLKRPVKDIAFIAGGSGVSSLRAMYRQLLLEGHPGPITLLFGFHAPEDFIFKDELAELQRRHPNFKVIPTITTDDPAWTGKRGRVTELIPQLFADTKDSDFYLCGPPAMVEDTIKTLAGIGVARHRIFREVW
ncbi:hypothetical protein HY493_05285 [Candidatus Woesearchaeota archaeon]|nr:hypothetical protein [Candidatus Woesearchaeota archaeon]